VQAYALSPEAKQDLRDIRKHYLKAADAQVARNILEGIELASEFLARQPGAGHFRTDLTNATVKFWQVFSYFVIYDPVTNPISMVRVLHSRRDLQTLLHRQL
jgi:antitoxin ParD1/3/4/toxin ParE1/3/4